MPEEKIICKCGHPKSKHLKTELVSSSSSEMENGVKKVKRILYKDTFEFYCPECSCRYREIIEPDRKQ